MKSIRRRLTVYLLVVIAVFALAANTLLYFRVRMALKHQYDEGLQDRAGALTHLVAWDEAGKMILEIPEKTLSEFKREANPDYLQVWRPDGSEFFRSSRIEGKDLAAGSGGAEFWYLALPDGRAGRATMVRFTPHKEADEPQSTPSGGTRSAPVQPPAGEATLVLASDMRGMNGFLVHLMEGELIASILIVLLSAVAVILAIRRGLMPLERLAAEADELPIRALERRFSERDLPTELQPIVRRLNDLLGRIEGAFRRERRFTSNVAHELRTPIAELRTLAEVAMASPRGTQAEREEFQEALSIARQMQALVESLLAIARTESQQGVASAQNEDLAGMIGAALKPYAGTMAERGLRLRIEVEEGMIVTDRALFESLLRNLISNAVTYAPEGTEIRIRGRAKGEQPEIEISNEAPDLAEDDLAHLTEPFWRKDTARTNGEHAGLGLALAAAYGRILGLELEPGLAGGRLVVGIAAKARSGPRELQPG